MTRPGAKFSLANVRLEGAAAANAAARRAESRGGPPLPYVSVRRGGALVTIYRYLGKHVKLGAGYNFTDFSDDLTDLDYDHQGAFFNIVGTM